MEEVQPEGEFAKFGRNSDDSSDSPESQNHLMMQVLKMRALSYFEWQNE